jgi:hypothetical protein
MEPTIIMPSGHLATSSLPFSETEARPPDRDAPDPVAFAASLGFLPDTQQAAVLRSTAKQGILNCTRQWGKSTTAAALAVYHAVHTAGALVVVASPSEKQSAELVRKAAGMLGTLGIRTKKDGIHSISLVLPNGSRIVGVPGNEATVRGLSRVTLLLIDEAARVPDEMYNAVRPMLATAEGTVWLLSTPWWTAGFFYEAWTHGGEEWERISVKATDCERISDEWLEKERRQMGEQAFRREYMTEFVQDDDAAFDAALIEEAVDTGLLPIDVDWAQFRRDRRY